MELSVGRDRVRLMDREGQEFMSVLDVNEAVDGLMCVLV